MAGLITRQEQVLEKEREEEAEYAKYDDMGNRIDVTPTKVVPEATESESKLTKQQSKPAELTLNLKAQSIV